MEFKLASYLKEVLPKEILWIEDKPIVVITLYPTEVIEVCQLLYHDPKLKFIQPTDLTCIDNLEQQKTPRFEVVFHLYSFEFNRRICVKVLLPDDKPLEMPTLTQIWKGFEWFECEAYDMYGVHFVNHPNLRRILLYESFQGYPLRKDYPIEKRQPIVDPWPGKKHL